MMPRERKLMVRLSIDEYAMLGVLAKEEDRSRSGWLRHMLQVEMQRRRDLEDKIEAAREADRRRKEAHE